MGSEMVPDCPTCGGRKVILTRDYADCEREEPCPDCSEPTITIPVAEYEELKKLAGFWGAVTKWHRVLAAVEMYEGWDPTATLPEALRAAIKEQEG